MSRLVKRLRGPAERVRSTTPAAPPQVPFSESRTREDPSFFPTFVPSLKALQKGELAWSLSRNYGDQAAAWYWVARQARCGSALAWRSMPSFFVENHVTPKTAAKASRSHRAAGQPIGTDLARPTQGASCSDPEVEGRCVGWRGSPSVWPFECAAPNGGLPSEADLLLLRCGRFACCFPCASQKSMKPELLKIISGT
jgi:hypothetical protein